MEEFARLGLQDVTLSREIKELRHDLREAIPETLCLHLIEFRNIAEDVGTRMTTEAEQKRNGVEEVAVAAGKRLSEALRALEEYGKTLDPSIAAKVKALRYRGYEIEQRLVCISSAIRKFGEVRLYVLITESVCRGDWFAAAEAALDGGADVLQLREKHLPDSELFRRAVRLSQLCRDRGKLFILNDRADIAALSHAHGVHLGQDDLPVAAARKILPPGSIVGVSTHSIDQAISVAKACPDYLAVGPMFETETKPQNRIAGPETLRAVRAITSLPLVAIGGIQEFNADAVLFAAPCCLAVCSAVVAAQNVRAAMERIRALLISHATSLHREKQIDSQLR